MYHTMKININAAHPLFPYLQQLTQCGNNIYNAALFRVRQVFTALHKEESERTENERKILKEIEEALPRMKTEKNHYVMPTRKSYRLSYGFLDALMKQTNNSDYYAKGFPVHCAQQMLKNVVRDMDSFYALHRKWKKDPSSLLGKPHIPHYKKKEGQCTTTLTNQACTIHGSTLTFAKTKLTLELGKSIPAEWKLQEVKVQPHHRIFSVILFLEDGVAAKAKLTEQPTRVCAIDLGVDNFAAVTSAPVRC